MNSPTDEELKRWENWFVNLVTVDHIGMHEVSAAGQSLIQEVQKLREEREATRELCEECDRHLLDHDAPELLETWWLCGVCANKRAKRHAKIKAERDRYKTVVDFLQEDARARLYQP
jgi:ribosomal protein L37AE/L43A